MVITLDMYFVKSMVGNHVHFVKSVLDGKGAKEKNNEDSCCGLEEAIVTLPYR